MKHVGPYPVGISSYTKSSCRCDACREAWRDYQRTYMRERYHGQTRRVPADAAVAHVEQLLRSGMSRDAVAEAAGLDRLVLKRIMLGRQDTLLRDSEDAILSVQLGTVLPGRVVPARKAIRLMDEMRSAGVPVYELKERLHIAAPANIRRQQTVRPKTWARLVVFYRHLARQGRVPADVLEEVGA